MDHLDQEGLYVDEQFGADFAQSYVSHVENRLKQLHTALPGIIKSYNPATNTAAVQPAIKRVFVEQGPQNLPLIEDVPVVFPGGGAYTVTFPVAAGDECVIVFFERAMDYWHKAGGIQAPSTYRLHDLSDACAFVGIRSQARRLTNVQMDGMELRNADRTISIKIKPTGIEIKGNVTVTGSIATTADITAAGKSLTTHLHSGVQTGGSQTGPPV